MKVKLGIAAALSLILTAAAGYLVYQRSISGHVQEALVSALSADTQEKERYFIDAAAVGAATKKDKALVHDYLTLEQLSDQLNIHRSEDIVDLDKDLASIGTTKASECVTNEQSKVAEHIHVSDTEFAYCKSLIEAEKADIAARHAASDARRSDENFERSEIRRIANSICRELHLPEQYDNNGETAKFARWKFLHNHETKLH